MNFILHMFSVDVFLNAYFMTNGSYPFFSVSSLVTDLRDVGPAIFVPIDKYSVRVTVGPPYYGFLDFAGERYDTGPIDTQGFQFAFTNGSGTAGNSGKQLKANVIMTDGNQNGIQFSLNSGRRCIPQYPASFGLLATVTYSDGSKEVKVVRQRDMLCTWYYSFGASCYVCDGLSYMYDSGQYTVTVYPSRAPGNAVTVNSGYQSCTFQMTVTSSATVGLSSDVVCV